MGLIDRIREVSSEDPRAKSVVPEWADDGEPCVIYAHALSVQDTAWVQKKHKGFLTEMMVEGMVDLIIRKAEDEAGKKLFTKEAKPTLMRAKQTIIATLFGELWGEPEEPDVVKT